MGLQKDKEKGSVTVMPGGWSRRKRRQSSKRSRRKISPQTCKEAGTSKKPTGNVGKKGRERSDRSKYDTTGGRFDGPNQGAWCAARRTLLRGKELDWVPEFRKTGDLTTLWWSIVLPLGGRVGEIKKERTKTSVTIEKGKTCRNKETCTQIPGNVIAGVRGDVSGQKKSNQAEAWKKKKMIRPRSWDCKGSNGRLEPKTKTGKGKRPTAGWGSTPEKKTKGAEYKGENEHVTLEQIVKKLKGPSKKEKNGGHKRGKGGRGKGN